MLFRSIRPFFGTRWDSFSILGGILPFPDTRPYSTIFRYSRRFDPFPVLPRQCFDTHRDSMSSRYSPGFHYFSVVTQIRPFSGTRRDSFFILVGIYLFPVPAWIPPFFGTHTDSTFFRYSPGQFFDTRTDSSFSGYSPIFYHFSVLT